MAFQSFNLVGNYQLFDGSAASGVIEIIPSVKVVKDTTGNVILSGRVKVTLEPDVGSFSVSLPDPNDPTLAPSDFGYTVVAKLRHAHLRAISFGADQVTGPTLDVEDITPVDVSTLTPTIQYPSMAEMATALADALADASADTALQVSIAIENLIAGAPGALDTLNEIAAQLGADESAVAAIVTAMALKAPLASPAFTGTPTGITKTHVGLGSVDNTADTAKPVSTAQATADTAVQTAAATDATTKADAAKARATHTGTQSADTLTDGTTNKAFLATERTKLTGIATAATANAADAVLEARANHTGTQLAATVSDLSTAIGTGISGSTYLPTAFLAVETPQKYGALANGSNDDTTAIQAAITAAVAAGGVVYLPRGTYKITAPLTAGNDLTMIGAGQGLTTIKASGITLLKSTNSATRYYRWNLRDFNFDGTSAATAGGVGLDLTNISLADVNNVSVNACETGILCLEAAYYNYVAVRINNAVTGVKIGDVTSALSTNESEWHLRINGVTNGVVLNKATNQTFVKPSVEAFTGVGFDIAADAVCQYITLYSPRFENGSSAGTAVYSHTLAQAVSWFAGATVNIATELTEDSAIGEVLMMRTKRTANQMRVSQMVFGSQPNTTLAMMKAIGSVIYFRNTADSGYVDAQMNALTANTKVTTPVLLMAPAAQTLSSNGAVTMVATSGDPIITLQANATSSTITGGQTGQHLRITWLQDATGGRTYVWPTNCKFAGGTAPSNTTASKRTTVTFRWDGSTNWYELSRAETVG